MRPAAVIAAAAPLLAALAGCVQRTISITTEPPGAVVWLNDREVGRTPVDVKFVYYGTYDVRLEREGSEPLMTSGKADAPSWEFIGIDFIAEVLPIPFHSHIRWNYVLEPALGDRAAIVQRAQTLRELVSPQPPPAADASPAADAVPAPAPSPTPPQPPPPAPVGAAAPAGEAAPPTPPSLW